MAKRYQDRIEFVLTQSTRLLRGCTVRTSRGGTRLVHMQTNRILVHLPVGLLEAVEQDKIERLPLEKVLTSLALAAWHAQGAHSFVALRLHAEGTLQWESRQRGRLHYGPAGELTPGDVLLSDIRNTQWKATGEQGLFVHTSMKHHEVPPEVRVLVYARDNHRCVECGTDEDLSLDHIVSRSRGGSDHESNLQTMCRPCNGKKGASA